MNPKLNFKKVFTCSDNAPISEAFRLRATNPALYGGVRPFSGPMHTQVGDPHWRNNYFIILELLST